MSTCELPPAPTFLGEFDPIYSDPYRHAQEDSPAPVEDKRTLVIGDVHGHFDRLEALLWQENIIGPCPRCDGSGDVREYQGISTPDHTELCPDCDGDGQKRIDHNVEVVQVGDLGHFGQDASPTGDMMCWQYASSWFDKVLWGNHDRAVIDSHHIFGGFLRPTPDIKHFMAMLANEGKLALAHSAHGFLITHAGLQAGWKQQAGIDFDRSNPTLVAEWINASEWWPEATSSADLYDGPLTDKERSQVAVRDAISRKRGGWSPTGGILWRDEQEKLYRGFPQVYGHSAQRDGEFVVHTGGESKRKAKDGTFPGAVGFNIDIGSKYGGRLGGIWLPEQRLVRVDL